LTKESTEEAPVILILISFEALTLLLISEAESGNYIIASCSSWGFVTKIVLASEMSLGLMNIPNTRKNRKRM